MNGELLQRCFVNLVCSMIGEEMLKASPKYKTHSDFAKAAFPTDSNPVKTWQSIRLGQKGKPRGVSIEEAFSMAQAFNEKVDRLLVKAEMLIEEGWSLEQDVFASPQAKQPGRPSKKAPQKNEPSEKQEYDQAGSTPVVGSGQGKAVQHGVDTGS